MKQFFALVMLAGGLLVFAQTASAQCKGGTAFSMDMLAGTWKIGTYDGGDEAAEFWGDIFEITSDGTIIHKDLNDDEDYRYTGILRGSSLRMEFSDATELYTVFCMSMTDKGILTLTMEESSEFMDDEIVLHLSRQ